VPGSRRGTRWCPGSINDWHCCRLPPRRKAWPPPAGAAPEHHPSTLPQRRTRGQSAAQHPVQHAASTRRTTHGWHGLSGPSAARRCSGAGRAADSPAGRYRNSAPGTKASCRVIDQAGCATCWPGWVHEQSALPARAAPPHATLVRCMQARPKWYFDRLGGAGRNGPGTHDQGPEARARLQGAAAWFFKIGVTQLSHPASATQDARIGRSLPEGPVPQRRLPLLPWSVVAVRGGRPVPARGRSGRGRPGLARGRARCAWRTRRSLARAARPQQPSRPSCPPA